MSCSPTVPPLEMIQGDLVSAAVTALGRATDVLHFLGRKPLCANDGETQAPGSLDLRA